MARAGLTNFVFETSNNPGTGAFILNGNPGDRRSFAMGFPNGGQVFYFADDGSMTEWGVGTLTLGNPNVLARTTIIGSNSGSLAPANFTGAVEIYNTLPAERAVWKNEDGAVDTDGGMRTNGWYESYTNTYNGVAPESRYILTCDGQEIGRFYGNAQSWGWAASDGTAVLLVDANKNISAPVMPPDFNTTQDYVVTCRWFGRNGVLTAWPRPDVSDQDGNVNYLAWSPTGGADGKGGLYVTVTAAGQTAKASVAIVDASQLTKAVSDINDAVTAQCLVNSLTEKTDEARVFGIYYRTDLSYPYLTINGQDAFNIAKREDMFALQNSKLDLSAYQGDFNTSDGRIINLAYGNRLQSFTVLGKSGDRINFPAAFSASPTSVLAVCNTGTGRAVSAVAWDSGGFTAMTGSSDQINISVYAQGPR